MDGATRLRFAVDHGGAAEDGDRHAEHEFLRRAEGGEASPTALEAHVAVARGDAAAERRPAAGLSDGKVGLAGAGGRLAATVSLGTASAATASVGGA